MNTTFRDKRHLGNGYLRWKKQLEALKSHDIHTVKKLAREAREAFTLKYTGRVQLALS